MTPPRVDTRSELLSLLTEACELEHGLACVYLFSGFSLKQELSEGLTWRQQQLVKKWAGQLYFVASQEMLHLAQVWNLLAAIGGTPYYGRPNFPQSARYFPLGLDMKLQPFSAASLQLLIDFEQPEPEALRRRDELVLARPGDEFHYKTVGELYSLIQSGFENIAPSELFVGQRSEQVDREWVDFPDIVPVHDVHSAILAIQRIREQGEGAPADREDCHYGIFRQLQQELAQALQEDPNFQPARSVATNPVPRIRADQDANDVNAIEDETTRAVAELFDDVYGIMLKLLSFVFAQHDAPAAVRGAFSRAAIELMVTGVKPLGEALTLLPLTAEAGSPSAGASFGLTRYLPLPARAEVAQLLVDERLRELAGRAGELAKATRLPQLARTAAALERSRATALQLARRVVA